MICSPFVPRPIVSEIIRGGGSLPTIAVLWIDVEGYRQSEEQLEVAIDAIPSAGRTIGGAQPTSPGLFPNFSAWILCLVYRQLGATS